MESKQLLAILKVVGKLKLTYRHCFFGDRQESVSDHSHRLSVFALLLKHVDEFKDINMDKVIEMCLIHDIGEAFTGDIPTFEKNDQDREVENQYFQSFLSLFDKDSKEEWTNLLNEMEALESKEAKLYKALDKLEAVISHNESPIETWKPLEYQLQYDYGKENVEFSNYLKQLKKEIDSWTTSKIQSH